LAIIGWGEREYVDAISHYNGDCWNTYFRTKTGECRYRQGRWCKKKTGWELFNPEYHYSPDMPDRPSRSWQEYAEIQFPIVDRDCLPSQRNYIRQVPIIMGMIGGDDACSQIVWAMKRELDILFRKHMTPELYGEPLEFLYFTLHCPFPGNASGSELKIGSYASKRRAFYCDLQFDAFFASNPIDQRITYFEQNLIAAVEILRIKFRKKRLAYDFDKFCNHPRAAFAEMRAVKLQTKSSSQIPPRLKF
jgi:hypothetical protein